MAEEELAGGESKGKSVNSLKNPFSIRHLPYGIVRFGGSSHLCVRLEDEAVSLRVLEQHQLLKPLRLGPDVTEADSLTPLLRLSAEEQSDLRARLSELLGNEAHRKLPDATVSLNPYPRDDHRQLCPVSPRDFVDFYCSRHHAFRVGCLFRGPENALPEQYFHLPIGYHGRSSTIFCSGTPIPRPRGIVGEGEPVYAASGRLDYELEVGFVLRGRQGPVSPDLAWEAIFGVVLVNDWSARDIQAFEYRPLGPFLGKSFATSVGAWVTPLEALEDRRCANSDSDHPVLPHLAESRPHHLDLPLEAHLRSAGGAEAVLCRTNLKNLAWSAAQMVSHLTSNGAIISPGDLIATGTVSGPERGAEACLLERTEGGKVPLPVGSSTRTFLADGDTVTLLGGVPGVGLAPCRGTVLAASPIQS